MSETTSSIPFVKNALEQLFADSLKGKGADGGNIQVAQGEATGAEIERVEILTASPQPGQAWSAIGAKRRNESYVIGIWTETEIPGKTQAEATTRAFALVAYLEDALRASPTLGLIGAGAGKFLNLLIEVGTVGDAQWSLANEEGFGAGVVWAVKIGPTRI